MPRPPELLQRLPLLRGLAGLFASVSPLFRGSGVSGRGERAVLIAGVLAPFAFFLLPEVWATVAGLAITAGLVVLLLRGRTLNLHGAEHRAIAAAEGRRLLDSWSGAARPSRFSPRCGTNFAAIALPVTVLADRLWPLPAALYTPVLVLTLSLAFSMELWRLVQRSAGRLGRAVLFPGLLLQRLTTREPRLEETQLAILAVSSVLRRELA